MIESIIGMIQVYLFCLVYEEKISLFYFLCLEGVIIENIHKDVTPVL